MTDLPRVSVIVPCYNHERFVRETIDSVFAQDYPDVELIVIDDASTDGSAAVIEAARREREFVFVRNDVNAGLNATLERGLALASGTLTALLGSDDAILPGKIEAQVAYLREHSLDGVFATGYALHPDGRRELIRRDRLDDWFRDGSIVRHVQTQDTEGVLLQSGLFRTDMLRELAPIRRRFKSDDWALSMRMLEQYRIGFMNQPLFLYRLHENNAHRDYWRTFPMRVEVVSQLTPEPLRLEALANLCASQAEYLAHDGARTASLRLHAAAFALDPSPGRIARPLGNYVLTRLGRARAWLRRKISRERDSTAR